MSRRNRLPRYTRAKAARFRGRNGEDEDDDDTEAIELEEQEEGEEEEEEDSPEEARRQARARMLARVERAGGLERIMDLTMVVFMSFVVLIATVLLLLFTAGGFYHLVPDVFFSDFASVWVFPLLLEFPAALVLKWTLEMGWLLAIMAFGGFCLVLTLFEFCSAVYAVAVIYTTSYTGSNYLSIGIWIALVLTLVLFIFQVLFMYFVAKMATPGLCSWRRRKTNVV